MTLDTLRLTIDHGQHEEATHAAGNHPGEEVLHWPPCHPLQLTQALQLQHRHRAAAVQTQHETITWTSGRERRKKKKKKNNKKAYCIIIYCNSGIFTQQLFIILCIFSPSHIFSTTHTRARTLLLSHQPTHFHTHRPTPSDLLASAPPHPRTVWASY